EIAAAGTGSDVEKDIFETDFEMPALDEESSSEAVPLDDADTDLESSDFDLSLNEEDSGSQVVPLDEGSDEGAETVAAREPAGLPEEEEGGEVDELLGGEEEETQPEEEEETISRHAVAAAPAHWGVVPALFLVPCVLVMFVLGLMSFELLHSMWGYKQTYK